MLKMSNQMSKKNQENFVCYVPTFLFELNMKHFCDCVLFDSEGRSFFGSCCHVFERLEVSKCLKVSFVNNIYFNVWAILEPVDSLCSLPAFL